MPFQTSWYVEKRVLLMELISELTLEDLIGIVRMYDQYDETAGALHTIVDTNKMTRFPTNPAQLTSVFTGYKGNPNTGWSVIISSNVLTNFVMVLVGKMSDARYKTAGTLEEAAKFLSEIDPTVAPMILEKLGATESGD